MSSVTSLQPDQQVVEVSSTPKSLRLNKLCAILIRFRSVEGAEIEASGGAAKRQPEWSNAHPQPEDGAYQ